MARLHFVVIIEGPEISDRPETDQTLASLVADGIAQNGAVLPPGTRWQVHRIRPEVVTPAAGAPAAIAAPFCRINEPALLGCGHCGGDIIGPPDLHVCRSEGAKKR